ncbi:hypothetical protein [Enterococcus sp. AZ109]|uniref:hypothetical protein n=1 Tax=Enterococcus sp. AZ109 TaxID=2774634 RepID=UPI003F23C806
MRLREIQKIINDNAPFLDEITHESSVSGAQQIRTLTGYTNLRISILELLSTGLFPQEKELIDTEHWLPSSAIDEMSYGQNSFTDFMNVVNKIRIKADGMSNLITENLHSQNEESDSLIISLPDRDMSFDEFAEILVILKDTFKLLKGIKEFQSEIYVSNFDVGSKWIVASCISSLAVSLFGNLVSLVQRSQVGTRQIKALDKQLESLDLSEEVRATVRDSQIKANQALYEKLTKQFLSTNDLDDQAEILSQITKVTENIDKVLSMGVGFEAAVTASNEVAQTFPDLKEQKLLDNTKLIDSMKQIDHSTDESES